MSVWQFFPTWCAATRSRAGSYRRSYRSKLRPKRGGKERTLDDVRAVLAELASPAFSYRTAAGIAAKTHLDIAFVAEALAQLRRVEPNKPFSVWRAGKKQGEQLFTLDVTQAQRVPVIAADQSHRKLARGARHRSELGWKAARCITSYLDLTPSSLGLIQQRRAGDVGSHRRLLFSRLLTVK